MPKSRIKRRYTSLHSPADIARIDAYDCAMASAVEACIITMEQEMGMEFIGCFFWHNRETGRDEALYRFKAPLLIGSPEADYSVQNMMQIVKEALATRNHFKGLNK